MVALRVSAYTDDMRTHARARLWFMLIVAVRWQRRLRPQMDATQRGNDTRKEMRVRFILFTLVLVNGSIHGNGRSDRQVMTHEWNVQPALQRGQHG